MQADDKFTLISVGITVRFYSSLC